MKSILRSLVLCLFVSTTYAQRLNLWEYSSASGAYAIGSNPAMMADSRLKWMFNIGTFSTNLGSETTNVDFLPFSNKSISLNSNSYRVANMQLRGPSFMYSFNNGAAVGIGLMHRSYQFQPDFFSNLLIEKVSLLSPPVLLANSVNVAVKDLIFSYAHPVSFGAHTLKAGIDFKLSSLQNFLTSDPSNINSTGSQLTFQAKGSTAGKAFTLGNAFTGPSQGIGLDLGFVYEYRPKHILHEYMMDGKTRNDPSLDKHLIRVGVSVTDIGKINSELFSYSSNVIQTLPTKNIDADLATYLNARNGSVSQGKRKLNLPNQTTFFAEVKVGKKGWSLGALARTGVKDYFLPLGKEQIIAFYPKNTFQHSEFSLPLVYNPIVKKMGVGLHVRLGALMFGSESINGFFSKKGLDPGFYFGFNLSKLAKRIQDSDSDATSNKRDKCPDIAGLWVFKGCPDTDMDGIENSLDKCPDHAGPKETGGCPDTDGDGIFDKNDACPQLAGPPKFNGCPDTDADGIADNEDDCPQKVGPEEFGGCPDSDGDGLVDSEDLCPDIKGSKLMKGCPDTDGDGLPDGEDKCITEKGSLANNGCPDADEDGIVDAEDACPKEKGMAAFKGCPDTDGDGIKNSDDKCPTQAGAIGTLGCPDIDADGVADMDDKCPTVAGNIAWSGCVITSGISPISTLNADQNMLLDAFGKNISNKTLLINTDVVKLKELNLSLPIPMKLIFEGNLGKVFKQTYELAIKEAGFEIILKEENSEKNTFILE
jgi:Family of unknown function (DUF5723)/Thrombospondin type 3 repeat